MTLDEIITDIRAQLDWRGPNNSPQGNIVIHRSEAQNLLAEIEALRETIDGLLTQLESKAESKAEVPRPAINIPDVS